MRVIGRWYKYAFAKAYALKQEMYQVSLANTLKTSHFWVVTNNKPNL
ncbi:hypothetical protein [uncultured Dokdonia sp.]|nr:hypothetical protein [uncultured Dokdonia sp.]